MHASLVKSAKTAIPLHAVTPKEAKTLSQRHAFLKASEFSGKEGDLRLIPGRGGIAAAVLGLGKSRDALALAGFAERLPDGVYRLGEVPEFCGGARAALAWRLGLYAFDRYRKPRRRNLKLVLPEGVDGEEISRIAEGIYLARDLINTPANDMGPAELGRRRAQTGRLAWREIPQRRRRGAGPRLSPDRGGGAGIGAAAVPDRNRLGQAPGAESDLGGKGRLLRYRRL